MNRIATVKLDSLILDPNNYRIKNDPLYKPVQENDFAKDDVQLRTLTIVSGEKNANISDLVGSFRNNGFLPIDQIQVRPYLDTGRYLVVEGNRRVATLKRMCQDYRARGADIGSLDPEIFDATPVIIFDQADDVSAMILMGLKHISGNRKWSDYNQALFVYDLFKVKGLSKDEICDKISISKVAVGNYLRALALVDQYKESDYGDQFLESKFPLFTELARNRPLKTWIGWNEDSLCAENDNNLTLLFSLISKDVKDSDEDSEESQELVEPAIEKRNELRQLSEMIDDKAAVNYLLKNRDLGAAYSRSTAVREDQTRSWLDSLASDVSVFRTLRVDANGLARMIESREILNEAIADNESAIAQVDRKEGHVWSGSTSLLRSIVVDSYKAFSNFRIDGLSRINIIAGQNNSGKTSLLEAIDLLIKQADVQTVVGLTDKRGKRASSRDGYVWTVDQIQDFALTGVYGDTIIKASLIKGHDSTITDQEYLTTLESSGVCGEVKQSGVGKVYIGRIDCEPLTTKGVCPIIFNTPFYSNEQYNYRRYYLQCCENKSIDQIISFVRENILKSVENIYWDDSVRRFKVSDSKLPRAIDLSQYGEGLQRVFLLALLFVSARNGIVLVDEIENAIHPSLLPKFVELITKLSDEFSVQVFATTHSKECIDSFVLSCKKRGELDDFSFIGLVNQVRANEEVVRIARVYSGADYVRACDIADVDLRGVV